MKVLAIVVLVVSSVSAKGSGPYLPSGWRPEGPAFYLPSEVAEKPAENSLKDAILEETEASGSEFLREYGPPKIVEVSQDITKQNLPEVSTEQAFLIEAKFNQDEEITGKINEADNAVIGAELVTEASVEQRTASEEETVTATEQQYVEDLITERQTLIQGKSINLEINDSTATTEDQSSADVTTESAADQTIQGKSIDLGVEASLAEATERNIEENKETVAQQDEENINSEVTSTVEEKTLKETVIKAIEKEVKNIAEAVVQQEENIKVAEVRTGEDTSGSLAQFPEGFLEYGPPGFREYGPPKGDEVLRTNIEETPSESQLLTNNETRRRRFSPKFRTARRH